MATQEIITWIRSLGDVIFPRLCCGCGQRLALGEKLVCAACQLQLPMESNHDWRFNPRRMAWAEHEALVRMGALARYERGNITSNIVRSLKFYRRYELGDWMGRLAVIQLRDTGLFDEVSCLLPIPLTKSRLHLRGFNQAEVIARGMAKELGIPVRTDVLVRRYDRESQTHFSIPQRIANGRNLFVLNPQAELHDAHVMVVDDVMTTGTTMLGALDVLESLSGVQVSTFAWSWTPAPPLQHA